MTWPGVGGVVQTRARTGTHEPDGDDRTHAAATAHSQTEKALQEALEQIASLQRTRQRDEEELLEARRALDEVGREGGLVAPRVHVCLAGVAEWVWFTRPLFVCGLLSERPHRNGSIGVRFLV